MWDQWMPTHSEGRSFWRKVWAIGTENGMSNTPTYTTSGVSRPGVDKAALYGLGQWLVLLWDLPLNRHKTVQFPWNSNLTLLHYTGELQCTTLTHALVGSFVMSSELPCLGNRPGKRPRAKPKPAIAEPGCKCISAWDFEVGFELESILEPGLGLCMTKDKFRIKWDD